MECAYLLHIPHPREPDRAHTRSVRSGSRLHTMYALNYLYAEISQGRFQGQSNLFGVFLRDPEERSVCLAHFCRVGDPTEPVMDDQGEASEPLHQHRRCLGVHGGNLAEKLPLNGRRVCWVIRLVKTAAHLAPS